MPCGATGSGHERALTLSGALFQGTWAWSATENASPDYNLKTPVRAPNSQARLFLVRSLLLGESLKVSFPRLIDMLKLSGLSHLTWGRVRSIAEATREGRESAFKWRGVHDGGRRSKNHRLSWRSSLRTRFWNNCVHGRAREANFRPHRTGVWGGGNNA